MASRHIVVDDETWDQLYVIKGPRRSMQAAIKELIDFAFPPDDKDPGQTVLALDDVCPLCETQLHKDDEGVFCPNPGCGWVPEGGET